MRLQNERKKMSECSFRPHIGLNSQTLNETRKDSHLPLHKRVGDIQKNKENYINKLKQEREKSLGLKFRPNMNSKSKRILKQRERSLAGNLRKHDKRERAKRAYEEVFSKQHTFKPYVNENSKKILKRESQYQDMDFFSRLDVYENVKNKRKQIRKKSNKSIFMSQYHAEVEGRKRKKLTKEEEEEITRRLADEEQMRRNMNLQMLQRKHGMKECYFKPKTNKEFNRHVKPTEFHELVYNERVKSGIEAKRKEKLEEVMNKYSFQPNLISGKSGSNISNFEDRTEMSERENKYRLFQENGEVDMTRITALKNQKERKNEMKKKKYIREELKKCTFQPNTKISETTYDNLGGLDQSMQPKYIAGYHQHLAKYDHAKYLKEEEKKRYDKVFTQWGKGKTKNWKKITTKTKEDRKEMITVPKPFKLHEDNYYDTYEVKKLALMGDDRFETANCNYLFAEFMK